MSVSSISANTNYYQTGSSGNQHQKRKEEFDTLKQALQSGDLSTAQQAFTSLQQDAPSGAQIGTGNSITTDISALGKALSSGDITGAQSAFATLQTDIQKSPPPGGPQFRNIAASTTSATTPSTSGSTSNADQAQQLFGQLANALQAGDLAGAQTAFNSLQALAPDQQTASTTSATGTATGSTNSLGSDVAALGTALQSGDLTSAQSAFASVQKDLQSAPRPHGGHGHHEKSSTAGLDSSTADSTTGTDLVQQLFTQLAQALQSGDLSGAQTAFGNLQTLAGQDQNSSGSTTASSGTAQVAAASSSTSVASTAGASSTAATAAATNPFSSDLNSLSQALQTGDLSSAQSAFTTLLTDLQNGGSQTASNTNNSATANDWRAQQHLHFYAQVVADRNSSNTVKASA